MKNNPPADDKQVSYSTPFGKYFRIINEIDKGKRYSDEYGSMLILGSG
jgi:hypothetical protein